MTSALSVLGLPAQSYLSRMQEIPVCRHRRNTALDARTQFFQFGMDLVLIDTVDQRVVAAWDNVLADHEGQPAHHGNQLGFFAQDAAMTAEQIYLFQHRVGERRGSALLPERTGPL